MKKVLIAVFLTCVFAQLASSQIPTARVTGGEVQGVSAEGISIFKGIPFAAPPVGDLQWKAPAPVQAWRGIKKADAFGLACMQAPNSMGNTALFELINSHSWSLSNNDDFKGSRLLVWPALHQKDYKKSIRSEAA